MRLYLSSFRMGDHPERLAAMLPSNSSAWVIANACDAYPAEDRPAGVAREIGALGALGIAASELDLRHYFGRERDLASVLPTRQLIWIRGGNTFLLRHVLRESGADRMLDELLRADAVAYGGYSAGICVLSPTLDGIELADDPPAVRRLYGVEPRWDGLGILDHWIVPHYRSPGHPETEMCERVAEHYDRKGMPHVKLRDGQAIVVHGDDREVTD